MESLSQFSHREQILQRPSSRLRLLVDTNRSSVSLKIDAWKDFLDRYHLVPRNNVINGHCEMTQGKIYYSSMKDTRQMHVPREYNKIQLLRIGKYAESGETVKATMQINGGTEPPFFNLKPRDCSAQTRQ